MQIKYCVQRNVSKKESIGIQKMNFVSRYFLICLNEWAFYVDCTIERVCREKETEMKAGI